MIKPFKITLAACATLSALSMTCYADTFYLFSADRAGNPANGSSIHRYSFDSENPGVLTPAPSSGQSGDIWGESEGRAYRGKRMTGVTVAKNGDVYAVCNELGSVLRFNGMTGAFKGEVMTGLDKPDGITVGPDGNLYVANNTTIVRCSPEGKVLAGAGQIGRIFSDGPLKSAAGLTFGPDGNLYVASQSNGWILRYDGKTGQYLGVFASANLTAPSDLTFGPDGHLYVASTGGPGFNAESGYVAKFNGASGDLMERLSPEARGALGIGFGPKNSLFVSSYWSGQISRYDFKTNKSLGVVAPGPSLYYLTFAKQSSGIVTTLEPWSIKAPRLAAATSSNKPSPLVVGAETIKGWQSGIKPAGIAGPQLTLANNKKTEYAIVLPGSASTMDQKAAANLSYTLQEMTGAEFRVVREGTSAKLGAKIISIGRTNHWKTARLKEAGVALGDEGYAIATKGANLYIWGGKVRGALYGVSALLEEDLGCRWYAQGRQAYRIPRRSTLTFRPKLRHFVPNLVVRDPYYFDAFNGDWSLHNKTNSPNVPIPPEYGGFARHAAFVHTYNMLVPPEKYFKDHPEYFAEVNGKRQPTQLDLSNPEVLRITVESVKRILRADPASKFISVSPNDGRGYCECPICSAIDKAEATEPGSKSGSLIKFCNEVAEAIEPEFPHIKITTLAYLDTFMPPKTIRPHKNVVIQLCTDAHAWKYQFDFTTQSQKFQNALKAWHAIKADMYIWDYTTSFVHYFVPMLNMPVTTSNIKFYMDHGAKGVMLQGSYQSFGGENGPMRSWVWAKQLWDPSLDTRALMKDFIYGYYGNAGEPIWNYNMMMWQIWQKYHAIPHTPGVTKVGEHPFIVEAPCSLPPDWELFNAEFITKTNAFIKQAESLAKDDETRRRVQVAKLPVLYLQLGQGLGYIEEMGGFKAGTWVKSQNAAQKAKLQALFDEFVKITSTNDVVVVSEASPLSKLTTKWRDILNYNSATVSSIKINPVWKFKTDPAKNGLEQGWQAKDVADGDWADVRSDINKGWESQGFTDYRGDTWYRQKLTIPASFNRRNHLRLFFGAVDSESVIYINGVKAFEHTIASTGLPAEKIWNTPFAFDPTPFLKFGEENTIAVKVYSAGGIRGIWSNAYLFSSDEEMNAPQLVNAGIVSGNR